MMLIKNLLNPKIKTDKFFCKPSKPPKLKPIVPKNKIVVLTYCTLTFSVNGKSTEAIASMTTRRGFSPRLRTLTGKKKSRLKS